MRTGHLQQQSPDSIHLSSFREHCTPEDPSAVTMPGRGPGHFHPYPDQGRYNPLEMNLGCKCQDSRAGQRSPSRGSSPECQGRESSSDGPLFPGGMTDDLGLPSGENPLHSAS